MRQLESIRRPALILLDDLHWADPDSLALVSFLSHRLSSVPVAIVATLRPWPRAALDLARHLAQQGQAELEHLMPLSPPAASAPLSQQVCAEISESTFVPAYAARGRNPSFSE